VTIELSSETRAAPAGASTRVTLTLRQLAGVQGLGTVRRAGRAELDQALAELGRIHR
jgi:hypothetical protein